MNVFIVFAHHEPKSFNGAMLDTARDHFQSFGRQVVVSDLYSESFNPVSDRTNFQSVKDSSYLKQQAEEAHATETGTFAPELEAEMQKLEACDLFIMQFPLWWFGLPGILKGWVDRVFAMGRIYGSGKWYDEGVFSGKKAMLALTTGGPESMYSERGLNGDIDQLLFPINHGILRFTGFDVLPPFIAWGPTRAGDEGRKKYLEEYRERLGQIDSIEPIPYHPLSDYDLETFTLKR